MSHSTALHRLAAAALLVLLVACAHDPESRSAVASESPMPAALADWSLRELPGKAPTRYSGAERAGRACVLAQASRSVSLWRRPLELPSGANAGELDAVQFDWWIGLQEPRASIADPQTDDAAARLVLGFDGDASRLSVRNRMQFELIQTLTGETPPFATLMYVWDAQAQPESLFVSQRSDRIRKIVVGSGPAMDGRWQRLRRDVRADYQRAFGEAPGRLISMAMMTDADNTASRTEACYGDILLLDAENRTLPGSLLF